jgi:hypothetical protein
MALKAHNATQPVRTRLTAPSNGSRSDFQDISRPAARQLMQSLAFEMAVDGRVQVIGHELKYIAPCHPLDTCVMYRENEFLQGVIRLKQIDYQPVIESSL